MKKVTMTLKDFKKEHKELPKVLTKGSPKQRAIEAAKQTKELKKYK